MPDLATDEVEIPTPAPEPVPETKVQESHRFLTTDEEQMIVKMGREGLSGHLIANAVGRHNSVIYRVLKRHGIESVGRGGYAPIDERKRKQIIAMHKDGRTDQFIAHSLGVGHTTVNRIVRRVDSASARPDTIQPSEVAEIIRLRKAGNTRVEIARAVGRSESTVDRVTKQHGLVHEHPTGGPRRMKIDWKRINKMRSQGIAMAKIKAELGMSDAMIYTRAKEEGISLHPVKFGARSVGRPPGSKNKPKGMLATASIEPSRDGLYHCPDCAKTFERKSSMGIHRRFMHGVNGTSKTAIKSREQRAHVHEPEPETIHQQSEEQNHNVIPASDQNHEIETHTAYFFGRFQSELQAYADSQDYSWKVLAAGVARLLALSSEEIRKRVGRSHHVPALPRDTA